MSFQPKVIDALNGELLKNFFGGSNTSRKQFWFPFYSNTEAALATNEFYIWKWRIEQNTWQMTKIFPHHLTLEKSPARHFSFRTVEVKKNK